MPQSVLLHCIIDIKHCHLPIAVKIAGIENGRVPGKAQVTGLQISFFD